MSAAALPESAERAQRAGGPSPIAQQMLTVRRPAGAAPKSVGMALAVGPAWHGYFGVQADVLGTLPPGSSLWLALVESIPAGSDGSPVARELVRSVAGPLTLNPSKGPNGKTKINHLRAMRWPDSAKPERLQARGWIESTDGTLLAMASPRCLLR